MQSARGATRFEIVPDTSTGLQRQKIAVLIPCYNEGGSVAAVVRDFQAALPNAAIIVFDNNSTDNTAEAARDAGAQVFREPRQGKGFVVRRMFADVDADIYVLVDGDSTYDAPSATAMIGKLLADRLDMVVGSRRHDDGSAYRPGHVAGNWLFSRFVAMVFGPSFTDILSGYRVLSRRFVKSFPLMSRGFEIETELTVHALELGLPCAEIETPYYARAEGSVSKLNTWADGSRILRTMANLYRAERPLAFFGGIAALLAAIAIVLAVPIMLTFLETGLVPRFPTAILCTGLMLSALLSVASGLVLDTVTRGRREVKLLAYLSLGAPGQEFENG
jgi:glycosyltransferase involved in cell wall biosynthesis